MELKDLLKNCGFSDKEIAVYAALVARGGGVVSDIAKQANINRSTTYVVLEMLMKRGVVKAHEERGIKIFTPLSLEKLADHLEFEAEKLGAQAKQARKLAAHFKVAEPAHVAPKIRFFTNADEMADVFAGAVQSLEMIRTAKSPKALPAGITISDNKVFFVASDKKTGFVVESPDIAASLKTALQG